MRVLFIGPLPEPMTGQSLACQVFHDALSKVSEVDVVNLNTAKLKSGFGSFGRALEVLVGVAKTFRLQGKSDIVYFTISESLAGNIKDIFTYIVCIRRLGRMIVHLHGGAGMRVLMRGRWGVLRWINSLFLRRVAAVIVLGQRHMDVFNGAAPTGSLHIVPNFSPDDLFVNESAIASKFEICTPLRIIFVSNLIPGKGHEELLAAFESLAPSLQDRIRIDFAGAFESENARESFLRAIKPHPQIAYRGVVKGDAKRRLFQGAHVFCLPTYYPYEGQPISILEAYAAGCAVITTDHSGIFDIFESERNGIAVAQRSPSSLADAIAYAVGNPDVLKRQAITNLAAASAHYTERTYNQRLLEIVGQVAERKG